MQASSRTTGPDFNTVGKTRRRWAEQGLDGQIVPPAGHPGLNTLEADIA